MTDQHPQKNSALSYPKTLLALNRTVGVPEALRGEVWQRFTGASSQQEEIVETYRILITKESPDDKVSNGLENFLPGSFLTFFHFNQAHKSFFRVYFI